MENYNNNAMKEFNEKGMDACPNCGRTFLPDRLVVHLRSCNKAHGKAPDEGVSAATGTLSRAQANGGSPNRGPAMVQRPKTIVCYIW